MKIDEKRIIQITRDLNGEVEKREDLRNEKNQTSCELPNTRRYRRQAAAWPAQPPIRGTLHYLANAIEGFTIVLLYYSSGRGSFEEF